MEQLLLQQLLKKNLLQEKYSLLFLYLFACAKEGHLSAYIDTQSISPSFQEIGQKEGFFQEAVLQSIASSFPQTPPSLAPTQAICRSGNFFYLQRFFVEEKKLVEALDIHIQSWQGSKIDPKILENQLKREQVYLTEEQKQAIFQGCTQPFFLLTGGPGTGKTYTAARLIQYLFDGLPESQRTSFSIRIAAPTGKAAIQLKRALETTFSPPHLSMDIQATTLHQLLHLSPYSSKKPSSLFADLVIVDESSMIDTSLMSILLQSLKANSQLILIGDPYQLPSVEGGTPFLDFTKQPMLPKTHLSHCKRVESASLLSFTSSFGKGNIEEAMQSLKLGHHPELRLYPASLSLQELLLQLSNRFCCSLQKEPDSDMALHSFDTFRLLSPLRRGTQGTIAINQFLRQKLQSKWAPWNIFPILITENHYEQQLFNGEGGVFVQETATGNGYALFPSKTSDTRPRKLPILLLPPHEIAYCLSVHKAQGSEFEEICLLLPEKCEMISQECIYTAVTRAKKSLSLFDPHQRISSRLPLLKNRSSSLQERLKILEPVLQIFSYPGALD